MSARKIQIFELTLVTSVAFMNSIVLSFYVFFSNASIYKNLENMVPHYLSAIGQDVVAMIFMFYVLYKQGKSYNSIGLRLPIQWMDILHAIGIIFFVYTVRSLITIPINSIAPDFISQAAHPKNVEFLNTRFSYLLIILIITSPLKEELIVRGFAMTQIFDLTSKKYLAVTLSVIIQFSYHLYQGYASAIMSLPVFILFALYFVKFSKLNPVKLAHKMIDLLYLIQKR
ncbi:MAG TPA: CPBP family intramembrane glutamic endopeptidase [Puia sp.]|nr:CPBP family intramembrane glutamic endopeptidase [Puia sp.]